MVETYEVVVNKRPFQVRRKVRWSECDPAGVVFTGKFVEFMLGATNLFYANLFDEPYRQLTRRLGVDTPCRGMDLDFRHALWPEDEFVMTVQVSEVRDSSFDLRVSAVQDDGTEVFFARFTSICIPKGGERKRMSVPDEYREALLRHQPSPQQ